MKIKIIDDFLPVDIINLFEGYLLQKEWTFTEYSTNSVTGDIVDVNTHWATEFKKENYLEQLIGYNIFKSIMHFTSLQEHELTVSRYHGNMQTPMIGGNTYHQDGTFCTAILMVSSKIPPSCGFEYLENEQPKLIKYKQNRLVLFADPELWHKGISPPSQKFGPRITAAMKVHQIPK